MHTGRSTNPRGLFVDLSFTVLEPLVHTDRPELSNRPLEGSLTTRVLPTGPCSGNGLRKVCFLGDWGSRHIRGKVASPQPRKGPFRYSYARLRGWPPGRGSSQNPNPKQASTMHRRSMT